MRTPELNVLRFAKYTRLGTWVALVSVLSITLVESFTRLSTLREHVWWGVGIIAGAGLLLLLVRCDLYKVQATSEQILRFYRDPRYWGAALVISGGLLFAFVPPQPRPAPPSVVIAPPPALPEQIVFPSLKVSALVVNGSRSAAVINGKQVWLGEGISGVKLVAVSATNILVELQGQTRGFSLSEDTEPTPAAASGKAGKRSQK